MIDPGETTAMIPAADVQDMIERAMQKERKACAAQIDVHICSLTLAEARKVLRHLERVQDRIRARGDQ